MTETSGTARETFSFRTVMSKSNTENNTSLYTRSFQPGVSAPLGLLDANPGGARLVSGEVIQKFEIW